MTNLATMLYPDERTARVGLAAALERSQLMRKSALAEGVASQVTEGMLALLRMPVGNLALAAYQKHSMVESARQETLQTPGSRQVVQLLKHTIKTRQEPTIDLVVNGITKTLARLTLEAEISVEAVTVAVEAGRIVETTPRQAEASLVLSAGKVELARAQMQPVDLGYPREANVVVDLTTGTSAAAPLSRTSTKSDIG